MGRCVSAYVGRRVSTCGQVCERIRGQVCECTRGQVCEHMWAGKRPEDAGVMQASVCLRDRGVAQHASWCRGWSKTPAGRPEEGEASRCSCRHCG